MRGLLFWEKTKNSEPEPEEALSTEEQKGNGL